MGFPSIPAFSFSICLYAAFFARSLKASSVRQYIGIIDTLHKEFCLSNPLVDNYFVSSLLKGIKHVKGDGHVQKLPMTIDILSCIFYVFNFRSSFDSSFLPYVSLHFLVCFSNRIYYLLQPTDLLLTNSFACRTSSFLVGEF